MNAFARWLRRSLTYPQLRDVDLDDLRTTILRRDLVKKNSAAKLSFANWYSEMSSLVGDAPEGPKNRTGKRWWLHGRAHCRSHKDRYPQNLPFVDCVCRAESLPFGDGSLGAMLMVNVLHHVTDVDAFFRESIRALDKNGLVVMVEPFVSRFSAVVHRHLHHEPFDPSAKQWSLEESGPLSGGNNALPWMIFVRDEAVFRSRYPD